MYQVACQQGTFYRLGRLQLFFLQLCMIKSAFACITGYCLSKLPMSSGLSYIMAHNCVSALS